MSALKSPGKARIPLAELASLPTFTYVTPSWGRDKIAFYWDKTGRFELYVLDLITRDLRRLTDGEAPRHLRAGFEWTRDDAAIIFAKDREGDEQHNLHRIDVRTREVTQLNDDPKSQEYAGEVSPDNRRLTVVSTRAGQLNLFVLDLVTGDWRQLTHFKNPAWGEKWSPSGEWIAFTTNESQDLRNRDGYLVRPDGSEIRKVLSMREGSSDTLEDWHPDGRRLAFTSDAGGAWRPGIFDLQTRAAQWLGHDGVEEYAGRFSKNGRWLSALRNQDSTFMPVLYDFETGRERALDLPPGVAAGWHIVLDDAKVVVFHTSSTRRPELLLYDLGADTYETLIPAEHGSIDPALFAPCEYVWYPSSDGRRVPALLYAPRDAKPGDRLPALVHIHGGPTSQFDRGFSPYPQFLADRGFVVLQPNIRGSTGYGVEWRDLNIKDWGGGDLEDVAAGAAFLKTLPYVDSERIGIFGGSFGGYMTFTAVTKKPDLFKIGAPWIGISDLHLMYEESKEHFRYFMRHQMGDPVADHALWRDRSAITHADKVKAKLLIIHGVNDPRCPVNQSRVFRERLLALGKREGTGPDDDFEYHEFTDEGHGPSGDIQGKIRMFTLLADFVERRL
ncbi:MAG: S9 family peptidase [bacterium]